MNMKKTIAAAGLLFWVGVLAQAQTLTGKQIMEKNFYAGKVKVLKATSTIVLINSQGEQRVRKLNNLQKLEADGVDSKIVAKFLDPADIRGTGFLQIEHSDADDDQWIYLPALQKSRRLVANNKKDSFFGSDFSYGDITLPKVETYNHQLTGSAVVDGADCYVVESVPATDQLKEDTGYSKKISWIRKDNFLEAKVDYYDLNGELLKTQLSSDDKMLSSDPERWISFHREVTNVQTGHKTTLDFEKVDAQAPIDDSVFSTRSLER